MNDVRSTRNTEQRMRVRVWFGDHPIADYTAGEKLAERYASSMQRRFACLRVTSDPVPDAVGAST